MQERIAVIGLGYVGLPVALAFARKNPGTSWISSLTTTVCAALSAKV